jgi:predicted MFS family arabinose efflux permease
MRRESPPTTAEPFLRPALAGAAATLCGIGLARFAYVPLFPAMVSAGWVSGAEAGFLGAVNLAGYLAGVLGGRTLARGVTTSRALDLGMALAAAAFAACGWNGGLGWLALWRGLAGVAGGILMALAGPAVQSAVQAGSRGSAGGVVVAGVGSGVIVGSLGVPALLSAGVSTAWLGLAALTIVLWAFAHPRWPRHAAPPTIAAAPRVNAVPLYVLYGVAGAGMVPHFVYFVDLAVRGRGLDPSLGAATWLLFGAGAIAGTLAGGRAADRIGAVASLRLWLGLQAVGVGLALLPGTAVLVPSAFLGGFGGIGITAVALTRARELAGSDAGAVWVRTTAIFAVLQAATGFALTPLFAATGSHEALFGAGLLLSVAALISSLYKA